jgi:hypothetical protein
VRRFWSDMNPTLRGFLVIALIAVVIVVLSLEETLVSLSLLARIAFFLAIAFFLFLLWRERLRHDIETWSTRARWTFYGGAALIAVDLGVLFAGGWGVGGLAAVALLVTPVLAGFSMWRVWRDEHTYGY